MTTGRINQVTICGYTQTAAPNAAHLLSHVQEFLLKGTFICFAKEFNLNLMHSSVLRMVDETLHSEAHSRAYPDQIGVKPLPNTIISYKQHPVWVTTAYP